MHLLPDLNFKSLLVTGGAGFIGSNFVEQALQRYSSVVVLDSFTYAGHPENLQNLRGEGKLQVVRGDIRDGDLVSELLEKFSIDAVVHFAAESHVDRSIEGPKAFIDTNIVGTFQLLNGSLRYWSKQSSPFQERFRYIQVSTDEVYGSLGANGFFSEKTSFAPNSPYSASKAGGDHLARAWNQTYGLPTIITHCSNNYGPKQYPEKLIPTMILAALNGMPLPIYGDGGHIRDWIHVQDHCEGLFLALEKAKSGSVYCFGGKNEFTNRKLVQLLCQILDLLSPRQDGKSHESSIQYVVDRLGHDRRYAIDDRLAEEELGFKRSYTFEKGLRQTIEWYLDHLDWCQSVTGAKSAPQQEVYK